MRVEQPGDVEDNRNQRRDDRTDGDDGLHVPRRAGSLVAEACDEGEGLEEALVHGRRSPGR